MASSDAKRSEVWKYFTKVENKPKVTCNLCSTELAYTGGSTGSIGNHLKLRHKSLKTEKKGLKQTSLSSSSTPKTTMSREKWVTCTKSLALMCARDLRPLSIFKGVGFRNFCKQLHPAYEVPGRTCVAQYVSSEYTDKSAALRETLKAQLSVAFSTDHWTSLNMQGFITLTAHFIDSEWNPQNFVLATREVAERHTGENTAIENESLISEFEIKDGQTYGIVTDNASNIVMCGKNFKMPHLRCFDHTLQLSIKGTFDKVKLMSRIVSAARQLVKYFCKSVVVSNELRSRHKQMNIPSNMLKIDCPSRWNSTYEMLERLLEQRLAVYAVLYDEKATKPQTARSLELTDDQWRVVASMIPVLKPLYLATRVMCSEEYPTQSGIYPIIFSLISVHLKCNDYDISSVSQFKKTDCEDIKNRFCVDNEDYLCCSTALQCTFLDPRYRALKFLTDDQRTQVETELIKKLSEQTVVEVPTGKSESQPETVCEPAEKRTRTAHDDMVYLLGDYLEASDPDCQEIKLNSVEEEISLYKREKPVPSNVNLFHWWKQHEHIFSRLAVHARKIMCIPATSVPSEHVFSTAGGTVTKLRSSLESSFIDQLVFLHKYMKNDKNLASVALASKIASSEVQVKSEQGASKSVELTPRWTTTRARPNRILPDLPEDPNSNVSDSGIDVDRLAELVTSGQVPLLSELKELDSD